MNIQKNHSGPEKWLGREFFSPSIDEGAEKFTACRRLLLSTMHRAVHVYNSSLARVLSKRSCVSNNYCNIELTCNASKMGKMSCSHYSDCNLSYEPKLVSAYVSNDFMRRRCHKRIGGANGSVIEASPCMLVAVFSMSLQWDKNINTTRKYRWHESPKFIKHILFANVIHVMQFITTGQNNTVRQQWRNTSKLR